ncbi:MAG: two pore domain potassium channel family protein [Candidatus Diapherotrites archaeon]|nr:two pore domain potassium channel family protein [Candidatus Diapherotrites archaeon]
MNKKIFALFILLFMIGTYAYYSLENWSVVDSLYFSVTTLTTIGYGDLYPTNDASKIFTIFYVIGGISLVLYALSSIQQDLMKIEEKVEKEVMKKINRRLRSKKPPEEKK